MNFRPLSIKIFLFIFILSLFTSSIAILSFLVIAIAALFQLNGMSKNLKLSGNWRFWALPIIFLALTPFFYSDFPSYSMEGLKKSIGIFLHFYVFNCAINLFNSLFSAADLYLFLRRKGWKKSALSAFIALCAFSRIKSDIFDLHSYSRLYLQSRYYFLKNPSLFFYAMIRNSITASHEMARLLYLRKIKI